MKPHLSLIAAMAKNRVIGLNNTLPWHLSEDLKHFKAITLGKPIIMGRKTWESLGKPLPGRRNIVISRHPEWQPLGAERATSIEEAIVLTQNDPEVFVIGGAQIYQAFLPFADQLILTEIAEDFAGDAYFPTFSRSEWQCTATEQHTSASGLVYAFNIYIRSLPN